MADKDPGSSVTPPSNGLAGTLKKKMHVEVEPEALARAQEFCFNRKILPATAPNGHGHNKADTGTYSAPCMPSTVLAYPSLVPMLARPCQMVHRRTQSRKLPLMQPQMMTSMMLWQFLPQMLLLWMAMLQQ